MRSLAIAALLVHAVHALYHPAPPRATPLRPIEPRAHAPRCAEHNNAPFELGATSPTLPVLNATDLARLANGRRVTFQDFDGKQGSGFAVQVVYASPDDVWSRVSNFEAYDDLIGTVREARAYTPASQVDGTACYSFVVSRIRLKLNVRFCVVEEERYAYWKLERKSWVLSDSDGFWYVEPVDGKPGRVRVWFCVGIVLNPLVPGFVVSLVSRLGLKKAFSWVSSMDAGGASRRARFVASGTDGDDAVL